MEGKDNIEGKGFKPKQFSAIRKSTNLGKLIKANIPEVADDYRKGMILKEIVRKYNITSNYNISERRAMTSVHYAIAGNKGYFGVQPFEGLITDKSELEKLSSEHHAESGRIIHKQKVGIHGRTPEQMREDGRKGGLKGGRILYELRLGVHGKTSEERSEYGRKAGAVGGRALYEKKLGVHDRTAEQRRKDSLKSVISRGLTPWKEREYYDDYCILSELEYTSKLSQIPRYIHEKGLHKGKASSKLIAEIINELYHKGKPVRTAYAIKGALYGFKKRIVG